MDVVASSAPAEDRLDGSGTALDRATERIPTASAHDPVTDVLTRMRGVEFVSAVAVAVLDGDRLIGVATIERLLMAPQGAVLRDVMDAAPPVVTPETDQEEAVQQAVQRGEPVLAVVDVEGRFRGFIPPHELVAVLLQEHREDMARLGGFLDSVDEARATSVESVTRRLWHRTPWLIVGLLGAMASAGLMAAFEAELDAVLAVAYFVPGIVYLADAVGTQTETLAIRGLSVGVKIRRVIVPESITGLLVGVVLGGLMAPVVALMTGDWMLAAAVAVAVFAASAIATLVALALPWLLDRLGMDPAFGSGPLATVVQDLLSIVIYLGAVVVFLG